MRVQLWFCAIVLSGCYAPSPPDGAYSCGADDGCPSGYHCTCGLCVRKDSSAACSFSFSFDSVPSGQKLTVDEHQSFAVTVRALDKNGQPATGFGGTVKLSSSWGDVSPTTLPLTAGSGSAMLQLNRETLTPAVATLTARYGPSSTGSSAGINVKAAAFTIGQEILPPFGWATNVAAEPNVIKVGGTWKMYFLGQGSQKFGFGLATSSDGITFTAQPDPVLQVPDAYSPAVFSSPAGLSMTYAVGNNISLAASADGNAFSAVGNQPVMSTGQCAYCGRQLGFPNIFPDLLAGAPDGGSPPLLMFFSAIDMNGAVSIGRASGSPDGTTWTPEPAPILSGDLSGEAVLLSPRVLVDGTVYKMWYSFARRVDVKLCLGANGTQGTCPVGFLCQNSVCTSADSNDTFSPFCEVGSTVNVGYATSSDGFFWTKSISNPVIDVEQVGAGAHALLASAVLPTDGVNADKGVTLWYSTFRRLAAANNRCVPQGIKRATRP